MARDLDITGSPVNYDSRIERKPRLTYDPATQTAKVFDAYAVREVLRASGFHWHAQSKAWQKQRYSIDELKTDWAIFKACGVELDAKTQALISTSQPEPYKAPPEPEEPPETPAQPTQAAPTTATLTIPEPAMVTPVRVCNLNETRERILRVAASGRISDSHDLAELRDVVVILGLAIDATPTVPLSDLVDTREHYDAEDWLLC